MQKLLEEYGSTPLNTGTRLTELIRRPELDYEKLAPIDEGRPELPEEVQEQVNINIKYDGYIKRQIKQVENFKKLENKKIPDDFDYDAVDSLRIEARQKLSTFFSDSFLLGRILTIRGRDIYCKLFQVILTDRGSEFSDPVPIECDKNGEQRSLVFYCDPSAPYQKGGIEVAHELIRRVLPKGTSFDNLQQEDIDLMLSHIKLFFTKA